MNQQKLISIVIPAYNEAENIPKITTEIDKVFNDLSYQFEIIFVDDGSIDNTIEIIKQQANLFSFVKYIEFSRNFGKDQALKVGIDTAKGDAIVMIDADLQHPPVLIKEMIAKWESGYEVVYAYRNEKNRHASWKNKIGSALFYKMVNKLSDIHLENGIADFRLLDRKVVNSLLKINEYELFLRGMIKWIGFKQIGIAYTPEERFAGESTYSMKSLIKLALHGITSFSVKPLYSAIYLGFVFSLLSLLYFPYVIYSWYANLEVAGWSSIIMTIAFFGGLNLIILGIAGIYIGKMFLQSKNRPNYIIRDTNL